MIQRKQTLFLLAVAILSILLYVLPVFHFTDARGVVSVICLNPLPHYLILNNTTFYIPMTINMVIFGLSIFIIFKYKNRNLQFKLTNLLALLNVTLVALFFLLNFINPNVIGTISYKMGLFFPIINAALSYLAAHFIKKDELLVRSADRIR